MVLPFAQTSANATLNACRIRLRIPRLLLKIDSPCSRCSYSYWAMSRAVLTHPLLPHCAGVDVGGAETRTFGWHSSKQRNACAGPCSGLARPHFWRVDLRMRTRHRACDATYAEYRTFFLFGRLCSSLTRRIICGDRNTALLSHRRQSPSRLPMRMLCVQTPCKHLAKGTNTTPSAPDHLGVG